MATTSFLSLFSGCGGLDVGLESLGWRCVAQSENDKDCVTLLKHRFPDVPNLGDVTKIDWSKVPPVDALVGGFPCQDLSYAGRGAGLAGDRSGLYYEMAEAIRQVRPRLVLIENVPGLLGRGLHVVTHDLARAGYAGTWRTLAAADVGAPHRRERVFVIARLESAEVAVADSPVLIGNFTDDGWESPQTTLLGAELLDRMPKAGAWTGDHVYEFAVDERDSEVLLLPTPAASESTPTEEYIEEMLTAGIKPDARLYMPGRKSFTQRTLSRIVPTLLPTPGANDGTGAEGETRAARQQDGSTGGPSLRDLPKLLPTPTTQDGENCGGPSQHERNTPPLNAEVTKLLPTPRAQPGSPTSEPKPHAAGGAAKRLEVEAYKLLPTPVVTDSFGSRRSTARTEEWESNPGTTLTDAIWETQGRTEDTQGKLLPTPTPGDVRERAELGDPPCLKDIPLLPTPVANPENPGAGGELRAAIHHGPERRTDSDTDTFGRPIRKGRLLPTPEAADASGGRVGRDPETLATGKRPSGSKASVPLATAIDVLLPTPTATYPGGTQEDFLERKGREPGGAVHLNHAVEGEIAWGDYEPAIRRWEGIVGRPAPSPTDEKGRLFPAFVEWMLGFPEGWVDLPGARRTAQLRMLGNSVQVQVAQIVGLWLTELGETGG